MNNENDNVQYLLWFVKSHEKMLFIKDNIREKHIWKDVEWGKRKKNYNPKGKDPGNVWLPTEDDGKGKITKHIILKNIEIIERCVISTSQSGDSIFICSSFPLQKSKILEARKVIFNNVSFFHNKPQQKSILSPPSCDKKKIKSNF